MTTPLSPIVNWADEVAAENEAKAKAGGAAGGASAGAVDQLAKEMTASSGMQGPEDEPTEAKHSNLLEVDEEEIKVQQADPNSPIYSTTTFEDPALGLPKELLQGLYSMKFNRPSRIQEKTLPMIRSNPPQNLIAQSQSGTGKTAAFTLGMLSRVDVGQSHPQALCVCPARELSLQIGKVVRQMGQFMGVRVALAVKEDVSIPRGFKCEDHLIVGTPGTVLFWLKARAFDPRKINVYVLDEADEMLDEQGMVDQTIRIKKQLNPQCQLLLFSATYPEDVKKFARRAVPNANEVTLAIKDQSLDAIKQYWMRCRDDTHKFEVLSDIYGMISLGQVIVFVNRKATADSLVAKLVAEGHAVGVLHSDLMPSQREAAINTFREGKTKVLVSTNVLSRGVDIAQVNCVVNFDLPVTRQRAADPETYLHRIGRTGRFGRKGISINFVSDDQSMRTMKEIESHFARPIVEVQPDDVEQIEKLMKTR